MTENERIDVEDDVLDETETGEVAEDDGWDLGDEETAAPAADDDVDGVGGEPSDAAAGDGAAPDGESATTDGATALQAEFDTLNDRHLRLAAEFNNFRRRSEQERLSAWSRAQADMVERFLEVLDDLHRVAELDLSNATVDAIMEGIDLVEKKFVRVLTDLDVEVIEPEGEPFDPETMEAMMRVPTEDEAQADTVAQVFQKGYALKGILVRPARVSVHTQG